MSALTEGSASHGEQSLYQRLGGYDVIAAVVDDLFAEMRADPQLARFAAARGVDSRNRSRQLTVDQLCALAGGPCVYIGRDMKTSHAGLGITRKEWEATITHLEKALERHKIHGKEKEEFVELFERYRGEIVEIAES
jgi:hemoglobin